MTILALGMCLMVALLVLVGPAQVVGRSARLTVLAHGQGDEDDEGRRRTPALRAGLSRLRTGRGQHGKSVEFVATDVASLLRAGSSPAQAWWQGAQVRVDDRAVPHLDALTQQFLGAHADTGSAGIGRRRSSADAKAAAQQAAGIVAACTVAQQTGAPLAPVLETVARSVVLAEQGRTEREAALAGPRSTARVLGWLPVLGIALGVVLGADPISFLLGSPLGLVTAAAGFALMAVGRRWIRHLIARARRAGELS